ncbi:hypothetical protein IF1G_09148 [Cordyceps javanica]|uniref:Uncharacterized protein n=1 Tax=Cordyceps javanica TaxID=43265 RepID=A0A545URI9_9HYPO|nr:hypothetical protein IF1G_09148 [Cordyceps javanica]
MIFFGSYEYGVCWRWIWHLAFCLGGHGNCHGSVGHADGLEIYMLLQDCFVPPLLNFLLLLHYKHMFACVCSTHFGHGNFRSSTTARLQQVDHGNLATHRWRCTLPPLSMGGRRRHRFVCKGVSSLRRTHTTLSSMSLEARPSHSLLTSYRGYPCSSMYAPPLLLDILSSSERLIGQEKKKATVLHGDDM